MRKCFNTDFDFGQKVILKTDPANIRIVTAFLLREGSLPTVGLVMGENETWHQFNEITTTHHNFKVRGFKG